MFMTLEILSQLDKDEKCLQRRGLSGKNECEERRENKMREKKR